MAKQSLERLNCDRCHAEQEWPPGESGRTGGWQELSISERRFQPPAEFDLCGDCYGKFREWLGVPESEEEKPFIHRGNT
jgi:hypothetical protein